MILKISDNKIIFISHKEYEELSKKAFEYEKATKKNFDHFEWFRLKNDEKNKLVLEVLRRLNLSPNDFAKRFININLHGQEARENTYNIIRDFIEVTQQTFVLKRDETYHDFWNSKLGAPDDKLDRYYPVGKSFKLLNFSGNSQTSFFHKIMNFINEKIKHNYVEINIDTEDVEEINGVFGYVVRIHFTNYILEFKWTNFSNTKKGAGLKIYNTSSKLSKINLSFDEFISNKFVRDYSKSYDKILHVFGETYSK